MVKLIRTLVAGLLALSVAGAAHASPGFDKSSYTLTLDPERTITIGYGIDGGLLVQAREVEAMMENNAKPVYMVINSPGGSVTAMNQFVSVMDRAKQRGVKFRCVVSVMAASAAFQILAHCNERYAFKESLLLFHPMWTSVKRASTNRVRKIYLDMLRLERPLIKYLQWVLGLTNDDFWFHYNHETLWRAEDLAEETNDFITLVLDVKGNRGALFFNPFARSLYGETDGVPNWHFCLSSHEHHRFCGN